MQGLHAPGTAGDDELQKRGTICRLRTAGGPTTLTTERAGLIYGRGANGKEIKIDLRCSTFGEKRGREPVNPDKGFSEVLHKTEVEIKMPDEGRPMVMQISFTYKWTNPVVGECPLTSSGACAAPVLTSRTVVFLRSQLDELFSACSWDE